MKTGVDFSRSLNGTADRMILQLLNDPQIRQLVRDTARLSVKRIRQSLGDEIRAADETALSREVNSVEVRQQLLKGLPGEAILIASAMAFDTFREGAAFFGLTSKTARHQIGRSLKAAESEKAVRLMRTVLLASHILGSAEDARAYLAMQNFALGGITPLELLVSSEGEHLVLNELIVHADCGPV